MFGEKKKKKKSVESSTCSRRFLCYWAHTSTRGQHCGPKAAADGWRVLVSHLIGENKCSGMWRERAAVISVENEFCLWSHTVICSLLKRFLKHRMKQTFFPPHLLLIPFQPALCNCTWLIFFFSFCVEPPAAKLQLVFRSPLKPRPRSLLVTF